MAAAGIALVAMASFFWGLAGGIGGVLMANGWDALVLAFFRGAIGLAFVLVWLLLRPRGSGLRNRRLWFWSALAGCGVAGNFAFYFVSIEQGSVAVAATLMYCAPVFVYLVSFVLKIETPTPLKWLAIAMALLGIVLLTQVYAIGAIRITPLGVGAGLLAGLSYAMFIFGFKYAARHGSPQAVLSIALTVVVGILLWPSGAEQTVAALNTPDWLLLAGLGMLGAGLPFAFFVTGLHHTAPAAASIAAMIEPVTAALFGVLVLHETLSGSQVFGMGLILATVTALSVYSAAGRGAYSG